VQHRLFGTDGIRGRVGDWPVTPEAILKLGWAAGKVLAEAGNGSGKVVIGKDTRVSGYLFESALESGLSAAGMDVLLLGPMPTPAIAYLSQTARADAGIVISASHNPYYDNGIKFFDHQGGKLADRIEHSIEARFHEPIVLSQAAELGKARRYPDAAGRYIEYCKSSIMPRRSLEGLKLVIDCAHGAAYQVAPSVFSELGATVESMGVSPDGLNINQDCGSTHTEVLQARVLATGADVGIALDGDGDRLIMVDHRGHSIDGDQLLYAMVMSRHRNHGLCGIVGTSMSNLGLEQACKQTGIEFLRAKVGDRHVLQRLRQEGWKLGGESSGHIICLDKSTTGDGIVAALEILSIMLDTGHSLRNLVAGMMIFPQTMINVRLEGLSGSADSLCLEEYDQISAIVREAEQQLGHRGRVVLRPSGTEPCVRVLVEAREQSETTRLAGQIAEVVRESINCNSS